MDCLVVIMIVATAVYMGLRSFETRSTRGSRSVPVICRRGLYIFIVRLMMLGNCTTAGRLMCPAEASQANESKGVVDQSRYPLC